MMGNETSTEQSVPIVFHHSDETIDCQDWHPHNTIFYEAFALRRFFSPCENQLVYGLNEFMKRKSQMIRRESIANSVEIKRHKMDSCAANIALNLQYIHLRYTTLWRYFRFDQNELRVSVWSAFRRISLN